MNNTNKKFNLFIHLTPEQKEKFLEYIPLKVYTTEKYIAIIVALIQLTMLFMFISGKPLSALSPRTIGYMSLYAFLFIATCIAIILYSYTVKNKKYKQFMWLRRLYSVILCIWVLGISYMELVGGKSLSVYCYLIPTTAAMLLMTPIQSLITFGCTWIGLVFLSVTFATSNDNMFGYIVNGVLVTILSIFISFRYYRSTAVEFCDRDIIASQYDEIEKKNILLNQLVNIDQLTGLNNRHHLLNDIYPIFSNSYGKDDYAMCLMLDIDYFKQYNDLYGHLQGDMCLQQIAGIIHDICKKEDISAIRYGGEEFLLIKISDQPFDAQIFAENLLSTMKDAHIERSDTDLKYVSLSAGLWADSLKNLNHIEFAIKKADDALYEAKSAGRNCIVLSKENKS